MSGALYSKSASPTDVSLQERLSQIIRCPADTSPLLRFIVLAHIDSRGIGLNHAGTWSGVQNGPKRNPVAIT